MTEKLKIDKIRQKKEINTLITTGKIFKTPNLIFHYLTDKELLFNLCFLISIPKRKIKLAVHRNYLKRVLKTCIYNKKNKFYKLNTKIKFIVVYNKSAKIKYIKLEKEILTFLEKFRQ